MGSWTRGGSRDNFVQLHAVDERMFCFGGCEAVVSLIIATWFLQWILFGRLDGLVVS
jgi:hypothetical protein